MVKAWRPGPDRAKVFTDKNVLITRELKSQVQLKMNSLIIQ